MSLPSAYDLQYGLQTRPQSDPQVAPQPVSQVAPLAPDWCEVMDLLRCQQEQLNQLVQTVASLQAPLPPGLFYTVIQLRRPIPFY